MSTVHNDHSSDPQKDKVQLHTFLTTLTVALEHPISTLICCWHSLAFAFTLEDACKRSQHFHNVLCWTVPKMHKLL